MTDQEFNDDTVIKEQLIELQMRLELDEISEEDYKEQEAELFSRLRALKTRQLELLHQAHTADSSSFVIEVGGDDDAGFWEPGQKE